MVSGHRRKLASRLAGLDTLPCIVRDLTDDEAIIVMVDSNLQRERVLPSEKAFAYKMKLDAMRRQQGERTDLTSAPVGQKFDGKTSRELLAIESPDSHSQIQRYIRLTNLIPEILDMVDDGRIAFRPAVELSYLTEQEQSALYDTMGREDCTPSLAQAIKMKAFSRDGKLTDAVILSIMEEEKPNQREQFRLRRRSRIRSSGHWSCIASDSGIWNGRFCRQGTGLPYQMRMCRRFASPLPLSTPHPLKNLLYLPKKEIALR